MKTLLVLALAVVGCDNQTDRIANDRARRAHEEAFGRCVESATLLATTTGSPSDHSCPNVKHRMRVQPATIAGGEEIGALVFCECPRDRDGGL